MCVCIECACVHVHVCVCVYACVCECVYLCVLHSKISRYGVERSD